MVVPASASSLCPSIVTVIISGTGTSLIDVGELVAEVLERGAQAHRGAVAQRAEGLAEDAVAERFELVEVARRAVAGLDPAHDLDHPVEPFAAGGALAAGLVVEELDDARGDLHHAGRVVDDDDPGRAEHRAGGGERSKSMPTSRPDSGISGAETPPGITALILRPGAARRRASRPIRAAGCPWAARRARASAPGRSGNRASGRGSSRDRCRRTRPGRAARCAARRPASRRC